MDEIINEGATAPLPEPESAPAMPGPSGAPAEPAYAAPAAPDSGYAHPAGYTPSAGYPQFPAYAPAPPAPRAAQVPPRWVVVTASVFAALFILALTFGMGVKVGAHAGRFDPRFGGQMMQRGPMGWQNDQNGPSGRNGNGYNPRGQGRGYGNMPGYGGPGRGFPRALPSPDATTQP